MVIDSHERPAPRIRRTPARAADGLQLGLVEALRDSTNYDPYGFTVTSVLHPPPPLAAWVPWSGIESVALEGGERATTVLILANGERATLVAEVTASGRRAPTTRPTCPSRC